MSSYFTSFCRKLFATFKSVVKIIVYHPVNSRYGYRQGVNKEAYVLACGPSLTNDIGDYIEQLSKKDVFVMNHFALADFFVLLKPRFYVLADPAYWVDELSEAEEKSVAELTNCLINRVCWDMALFVPIFALQSRRMKLIKENKHIKLIGYSSLSLNGFHFCRNYWYRKNMGMSPPQTVLNASVFLALNSGYKVINVLGADHTFIKQLSVGFDNLIYVEDAHFYDTEKAKKTPIVDGVSRDWTIETWLTCILKMFRSHYVLKDYAKYLGAEIYNLTSETLLDVYKRKKIEDTF